MTIPLCTPQTLTPTLTRTPSLSTSKTPTPTPTSSITRTLSSSVALSPTPTITKTVSNTPSVTPTISVTQSRTPSLTTSLTPTHTSTITPTQTPTRTITSTSSLTSTLTTTPTPSVSLSPSLSLTSTPTRSSTSTITPTKSSTPTLSITVTQTRTKTATNTITPTQTRTRTRTASSTLTPSITRTVTTTRTTTRTRTSTRTPSFGASPTPTPSMTRTQTPTISETPTITPTISETPTLTPTISETPTITPTISETPTLTPSITTTISETPTLTPTISQTPTITPTPSETPVYEPISGLSGNLIAVYSVELAVVGYTGDLMTIQRSSDSGILNIAYNYNYGDVETWIGGSDAYVVTWKDQSGNSSDLTSTGNVLFKLEGDWNTGFYPYLEVNNSNYLSGSTTSLNSESKLVLSAVSAPIGTQDFGGNNVDNMLIYYSETGGYGIVGLGIHDDDVAWRFGTGFSYPQLGDFRSRIVASNNLCVVTASKIDDTERILLDSTQLGGINITSIYGIENTSNLLAVGGGESTRGNSKVCEIIVYTDAVVGDDIMIANNQKGRFGIFDNITPTPTRTMTNTPTPTPTPEPVGWCCEYLDGELVVGFGPITEGACQAFTGSGYTYTWTEGAEIECSPTNP